MGRPSLQLGRTMRSLHACMAYNDRLNRSQRSKVIYKACCWNCNDFTLVKLSDGSMIGRLNASSPQQKMTIPQLLLTVSLPPDITLSGIILN